MTGSHGSKLRFKSYCIFFVSVVMTLALCLMFSFSGLDRKKFLINGKQSSLTIEFDKSVLRQKVESNSSIQITKERISVSNLNPSSMNLKASEVGIRNTSGNNSNYWWIYKKFLNEINFLNSKVFAGNGNKEVSTSAVKQIQMPTQKAAAVNQFEMPTQNAAAANPGAGKSDIKESVPVTNPYLAINESIRQSKVRQNLLNNGNIDSASSYRADTCVKCFQTNFTILLNQENLCRGLHSIDILITIASSPNEHIKRQAIRKTWGSKCNQGNPVIKCVFLIGNTQDSSTQHILSQESSYYKDIVQFDFVDSYGNLTYKTLTGLSWAAKYCSSAQYVMKTDTDMFVNTDLLPILVKHAPKTLFMGGFCWGPSSPNRDAMSKWFVPLKSYKHDKFPAMCSGTGYVMSKDVVISVLRIADNIPFFHLEDVYISLCLKTIGVKPVKLAGFDNLQTPFQGCHYKNYVITSHYISPEQQYTFWDQLKLCSITVLPNNVYRELPFPYVS